VWRAGEVETDQDVLLKHELPRGDYCNGMRKPRDMHSLLRVALHVDVPQREDPGGPWRAILDTGAMLRRKRGCRAAPLGRGHQEAGRTGARLSLPARRSAGVAATPY
jgi:hypothetical protein